MMRKGSTINNKNSCLVGGHQIGNVSILVTCKYMFLLCVGDENWWITKRTADRRF